MADQTETKAIADLAARAVEPRKLTVQSGDEHEVQVVALPTGVTLHSVAKLLEEQREKPARRRGTVACSELASFVAYVKRYADEHTAIFASTKLTAVLDYHEKTAAGAPRWGQHRATYDYPISDEWKAWTESTGDDHSQADFAAFIEERIVDVADPATAFDSSRALMAKLGVDLAAPAQLVALSRGLSVQVGRRVINAVNLQTGEAQVTFAEEHRDSAGAQLKIPAAFLVEIPVFRGAAAYQLVARLRYRVQGGAISWRYDLQRYEAAFADAVREAAELARHETGCDLFYGAPES